MKKFIIFLLCIGSLWAKELTHITLQLTWMYQFQFAGYIMAKEKGFYEGVGLDVTLNEYASNKAPIYQVRDGKAQFAISRSDLIVHRLNEMANYLQLFALTQASPLQLDGIKKSGITKLSDLKGKKILYFDTPELFASVYGMLETNDISPKDYQWVKAEGYDLKEIMDGRADVVAGYSTMTPNIFKKQGFEPIAFHPKDYGFDFYGDILFTTDEYEKQNPIIVKNFYEASLKGWEYAFANVDETIDIIKAKYDTQKLDRDVLEYEANAFKELAFFPGIPFGDINPVKLEKIANTFKLLGKTESTQTDFNSFVYKASKNLNDLKLNAQEENFIKENPVIKVGLKGNVKPISFIDESGLHTGMSNSVLKLISQKSGLRFTYVTIKEEAIDAALSSKKIDIYIDIKAKTHKEFIQSRADFELTQEDFLQNLQQGINDIYFIFNYDSIILKDIFDKNLLMLTSKQKESIKRQWIPKVVQTIDWTMIWQISSVLALIIIALLYKNIQQKKSEQKRLSRQVDEKTKDLQMALDDKALLLKELNHRVKNNMQMIISLIRLQEDRLEDEKLKSVLLTIQNRINAMSHLHELLYTQDSVTHIHADDYFELLINDLKHGFDSEIDIAYDIQVDLNIEQAIYVGIILNELVTNAIKYAFEDENNGQISIELKQEDETFKLRVKDNGIGFKKEPNDNSLGMVLIKRLVQKQLKGSVSFESKEGVEVNINWSANR